MRKKQKHHKKTVTCFNCGYEYNPKDAIDVAVGFKILKACPGCGTTKKRRYPQ